MAEIRVENLHKAFGDFVAVKDSSFTVNNGEFLALLGGSGSGKSTLVKDILYSVMANKLNKNGTSAANVVDSWYIIAQRYTRVPMWIYTKLNKQTKVNNVSYDPDPAALQIYLNKYQISNRDFKLALKFKPEPIMKEIEYIEKQIKANE
jgi:ABC-type nitrate/sulfonate/bicarbonate transport system ATPase subunit